MARCMIEIGALEKILSTILWKISNFGCCLINPEKSIDTFKVNITIKFNLSIILAWAFTK